MQKMQISEFLHLLGHSSGSAGSWDVLRGGWHHTAISGDTFMAGCSLSGWVGVFCVRFLLLLRFSVTSGWTILNRTTRIFHQNFVIFVRRLLDVTHHHLFCYAANNRTLLRPRISVVFGTLGLEIQ